VLTSKVIIDSSTINKLTQLKYIGVMATGYNIIDVDAARTNNIVVSNVPAYSTESTAQGAFALLLALTNQTGHYDTAVKSGRWASSPDFCFWDDPIIELSELTIGLVGFGAIGKAVARMASAFGMRVMVNTRTVKPADRQQPIEFCNLNELLSGSDVVSLHCPLSEETANLINAKRISLMRPGAFLINTSRGGLIDEEALADALKEERIGGAGLGVLAKEPPDPDNPLLSAPRCILTPHNAWATVATRKRLVKIIIGNIKSFLSGAPVNVVSS
jgi:glycerate dehydrogenase